MRIERLFATGTMTATRRHRSARPWLLWAAEAAMTMIALALLFGVVGWAMMVAE